MHWLWGGLLLVGGIFLGLVLGHREVLELSKEVSVPDLFGLVVTLLIASFIAVWVERSTRAHRAERELLIEQVRAGISATDAVRQAFLTAYERRHPTEAEVTRIRSGLRTVANGLHLVDRLIEQTDLPVEELNRKLALLRYLDYKAAVTGGHYPTSYGDGDDLSEERCYRELAERLFLEPVS